MDTEELEELIGAKEESPEVEHTVYELFKWSLILKGTISVAEVAAGIALLFIPPSWIALGVESVLTTLAPYTHLSPVQHIVDELLHYSDGAVMFAAIFLLSRGLIKCFLIWALLKGIVWAYPYSLAVMSLFVIYQIYEYTTTHSITFLAITAFDLVVMYFVWREWRIVKRHQADASISPV